MQPHMPAKTVVSLSRDLDRQGVRLWIDGGWGIDALLGAQTRPHGDLDVVVQTEDLAALIAFLRERGYDDVPKPDTRPWNFVLGDTRHQEVDIHVVTFAPNGDGVYGPPEIGQAYPAWSLTATGIINGHQVRCTTAEFQVASHTGYNLTDTDFHDVSRICEKFGIDLPLELQRFDNTQRSSLQTKYPSV